MRAADLLDRAQRELTVCNACRYCEQYCPVFPAIEAKRTFAPADLALLANLCHNCGECLYACQYAPPHEFGINLPRTLSSLRSWSYEEYCWPRALGAAFNRHGSWTACALAATMTAVLSAALLWLSPGALATADGSADFYAVMPHAVMVTIFGAAGLFALLSMTISGIRFWRHQNEPVPVTVRAAWRALRDAASLRHLHGGGIDCASGLEQRTPWRRAFHHCTSYGFLLCFASTSVAALYHGVFGWHAPYAYTSVPVLLGTAGGIGLVVGPAGLAVLRRRRDPLLRDESGDGLDTSLLLLLALTSLTGLLLLALRHTSAMGPLLVVHLGVVLALLLTLPYSKFVHALYRVLALVRYYADARTS
jgi:citrate/tricarballylate utilization protein